MKTDDLVAMLAHDSGRSERQLRTRKLATALVGATLVSGLLMLALLGLRHDLAAAADLPMFWVKLAYPGLVALATLTCCWRLAQPGRSLANAPTAIALVLVAMSLLAVAVLASAQAGERRELLLGTTWQACLVNIFWLSLPVFAALVWGMQQFAPTRARLAGATCGLAAGALAAVLYALHCPELTAPFIALWYLLGMFVPAAAGAALGPRLFRW